MNKSLLLLLILLLTGCASFQVSTLNHDPIYVIEGSDAEITVIDNEFELQRLLRTDFNFRYDFAQYAISQPRSFDWNNRVLGNRYSFYNPYYSRSQMWNDWVWGYNWNSPHRWSPFGYDRWGYNNYGYGIGWSYSWNNRRWSSNQWGNSYGWNNYYGWNNGFYNRYRGTNVAYHTGRRGNTRTNTRTINRRTVNNNRVVINTPKRDIIKNKPRVIKNKPRVVINNKPRINNPRPRINPIPRQRVNTPTRTRSIPNNTTRSNSNPPTRSNSRRKN